MSGEWNAPLTFNRIARFAPAAFASSIARSTAAQARSLLLRQLTSPVRWTTVVQRLASDFPGALFVEMGPGNVLTGLVRKIAPAVQTATCGTLPEVEQLLARVA